MGGVIGARLFEHGHEVVLVARGDHHRMVSLQGLRLEAPDGAVTLPIPAMDDAAAVDYRDGDVLVCPITSPAWAPIFSNVRAVVTDIGGVMSHAAIVCREYGLPAVVGTGRATAESRAHTFRPAARTCSHAAARSRRCAALGFMKSCGASDSPTSCSRAAAA